MNFQAAQLTTPVAFIIFNRPDVTQRVFDAIRAVRPKTLLVIADGPREDRLGESELCIETRKIINGVDWPCDVKTNFSDTNLGCKLRPATGIDWVFECVPEAIILEDDCLPHPSFFYFCEQMLNYYRDDQRIGMIAGSNFQFGKKRGSGSYYFSKYMHIWGWATWRRAWKDYDINMTCWKDKREASGVFKRFPFGRAERAYWSRDFDRVAFTDFDAWDHQWSFTNWVKGRLAVMPNVNLISNIGFGRKDATHTFDTGLVANLPTYEIFFPLKHPLRLRANSSADRLTRLHQFSKGPILRRIVRRLKCMFKQVDAQ